VPEPRPLALPELLELLPELPELPAELPELPELCAELREPELLVPVLAAGCCAALACAEPGSARLTPAAASTLAAPAAAVTARSLDWLRFLAAIAACRSGLLCAVILVLSPMSPESRIGGEFLGTLCGGCEIPLVVRQARLLPGRGGGRPRPGSAGSSLASPRR
jgi:hypothetical protein